LAYRKFGEQKIYSVISMDSCFVSAVNVSAIEKQFDTEFAVI
jgi:hypothetical protein